VIAFSPGFLAPAGHTGSRWIFVSHGTDDGGLPKGRSSRRIVPELKRGGYDVFYREFDGGHTILPEIAQRRLAGLRKISSPKDRSAPFRSRTSSRSARSTG
jgi:phospholipase/carboxylesterase